LAAQSEREKVAVLGGGPAAIAAAFELTATPELRDRFEVTVHQLGWRLGGKCASGRNLEHGGRIEEHGLHVWFGFYDNAFSVMRAAYDELARPAGHPLATLEDAFESCDELVLYDRQGKGWHGFSLTWPRNDEIPGADHELPDFWEIAAICCGWAAEQLHALTIKRPGAFPAATHRRRFTSRWFSDVILALGVGVGVDAARGGEHLLYLAHHLTRARTALRKVPHPRVPNRAGSARPPGRVPGHRLLAFLLTRFRDWMWEHVVREDCDEDPHLRLFFTIFDIFASATAGIVTDGVLQTGWDAINDRELCEWLREHGAKEITLGATCAERSPILRSIYDVAFAYPAGVIEDADAAAGTAMNNLLRLLFTYRGSLSYKMQAGMGDTVFTPLYEVLKRRGVKFEFFHAVTDLRLSSDGSLIDAIEIVPQVELKDGAYHPLVDVAGRDSKALECWPSEPRWDQLQDGSELRQRAIDFEHDPNPLQRESLTLHRGNDFHAVVLGIPVAALPDICARITARPEHERFARMLAGAKTVRTQAFQLWLTKPTPEIGWEHGTNSITGSYVEPLDTWCDMTHLLAREAWSPSDGVRGIAYFCGVLDDRDGEDQAAAEARVKQSAQAFLEGDIGTLWPRAVTGGPDSPIDWTLLADAQGRSGAKRLEAQYWRANTTASERYALTPAKSVAARLAADETGVANLAIAGDWTRNGVDAGCVESAVTSGLQAARALIGHDRRFIGESATWLTDRGARDQPTRPPPAPASRRGDASPPAPGAQSTTTRPGAPGPDTGAPPVYVEYGARVTVPPPFVTRDGRLHGLVLEGDRERIDALCDRMFNAPAAGAVEYRPLTNHVLLLVGSFGHVASLAPGFDGLGSVQETQLSLWVPVSAGHREGETFVADRMCMAVPYIFVDNPMSYAGGREDLGYPKSMARFEPSSGFGDRVQVQAFGGDFAPGNQATWVPVLELARASADGRQPAPAEQTAQAVWHAAEDIAHHLLHPAEHRDSQGAGLDMALFRDLAGDLLHKRARQVFLKQFRDAETVGRACYRAVVEAPIHVTSAKWRPSPHEWQVTVHPLGSHPIADDLGVGTQATRLAFELEMDMVVDPGVVVAP
jgi:uncharacterized protein with NAD-binding domain and iron-sulfur cluster